MNRAILINILIIIFPFTMIPFALHIWYVSVLGDKEPKNKSFSALIFSFKTTYL